MVFDDLRQSLRDLMGARLTPDQRRPMLVAMKESLVRARMGIEDLRAGVELTRTKLATDEKEMETARRRKGLAEEIADAETAAVAARFEAQFAERVAVQRQKLAVQEQELALAERELSAMTQELKAATLRAGAAPPADPATADRELGLGDESLRRDLDALAHQQRREARESDADARLAELKRRMGK
jgi:hypothetical protein